MGGCSLGVSVLFCTSVANLSQFQTIHTIQELSINDINCVKNVEQSLPNLKLYRNNRIGLKKFRKCCAPGEEFIFLSPPFLKLDFFVFSFRINVER